MKTIPFSQGQRIWVSGEPYSHVSALVGAAQAPNREPAATLPGLTARDLDPSGVLQTGPPRLFTHPPRASRKQSCVTFVTARPPAPGLYPQPYPRHSTIPRPAFLLACPTAHCVQPSSLCCVLNSPWIPWGWSQSLGLPTSGPAQSPCLQLLLPRATLGSCEGSFCPAGWLGLQRQLSTPRAPCGHHFLQPFPISWMKQAPLLEFLA